MTGRDTAPPGGLSSSIIIPTYNRPVDLEKCLRSILAQTVRPLEVLVIDDGALPAPPLQQEFLSAGVGYVYHRKKNPGLTASRNKGVELSRGDIVLFLDDDVVLSPSYVEEILRIYADDASGDIGGVGGLIDNNPPMRIRHLAIYLLELVFLLKGFREGRRALAGGSTEYGTTPFPLRKVTEVEFLSGGVSSYRRQVCREIPFSEAFVGYGLGEDKDYSLKVGRRHRLLVNPAARLSHFHSPSMRFDKRQRGRELVRTKYRLFRDHRPGGLVNAALFWYSMAGFFFISVLAMLFSGDRSGEADRVRGIASALKDLAAGKL